MPLTNELKERLLKTGAVARLKELDQERATLLKILGIEQPSTNQKAKEIVKTVRVLKNKNNPRAQGWTKQRLAKFRATMKRKYGEPQEWPSSRAARSKE